MYLYVTVNIFGRDCVTSHIAYAICCYILDTCSNRLSDNGGLVVLTFLIDQQSRTAFHFFISTHAEATLHCTLISRLTSKLTTKCN